MVGYDSEPLFNMGALMAVLPLLLLIVAAVVGGRWVGRNAAGARRIAFWGVPGACAAYVVLNVLLVMLLVGRYSSASAILMQEAGLSLMFSVLVPYLPPVVLAVACALRPGKVSYRVALVWDALTLGTMVLRDVNLYPSLGYAISLGSFEILLSTACLVGVLFFSCMGLAALKGGGEARQGSRPAAPGRPGASGQQSARREGPALAGKNGPALDSEGPMKPGSATRRGIIGAGLGLAGTAVVMLLFAAATGSMDPLAVIPLGALYGFGLTFANLRELWEATKRSAGLGGAGLAIGVIIARWKDNYNYGILGFLYFLLKVAWHFGMGWIPGVLYGVREIAAELRGEGARSASFSPDETVSAAPLSDGNPAADRAESVLHSSSDPTIVGLSGPYEGARIPVRPYETIVVGSDPARAQIVLPASCAAPAHCSLSFDAGRDVWKLCQIAGDAGEREKRFDVARGSKVRFGMGQESVAFMLE